MNSRDFCYWLQGHLELGHDQMILDKRQVELIRKHLNMVFYHEIDPSYGDKAEQDTLKQIHEGPKDPGHAHQPRGIIREDTGNRNPNPLMDFVKINC